MRNRVTQLFLGFLAVGAVVSLSQTVKGQVVVYNNGTQSPYANANYDFNNATAGNEIVLGGSATSDYISQFTFQFGLVAAGNNPEVGSPVAGTEEVDLSFYANTGPLVNGYASPGSTPIYDSGFYNLSSIGLTGFSLGQNLTYTPDVVVPQDFTWVVTFADVPNSELAGLALRSPPTVGANYGDAWQNTGSGWQLVVASAVPGNNLEFGAEAWTPSALPDSSCLWFSVMTVGAGFWWMNRGIRLQPSK